MGQISMNTSKIRTLFLSSRPISWINTAYPFAAAYIMTTHAVSWPLLLGSLYFLIPYNLFMYGINDVFDYESDLRNPRKGGIEGAVLAKQLHKTTIIAVLLTNVPFVLYLLSIGTVVANTTLAFVLFMVLAYSAAHLRFKEKPLLDSFTSACHFAGPALYALTLHGWHASYLPYILAFLAWGMASHAFGAVQDIIPDREAQIDSIATKIGAQKTVRLSLLFYATSGLLLANQNTASRIIAACCLLYIANIWQYRNLTDNDSGIANHGWKRFIPLNWLTGAVVTIALILTYRSVI